MKFAKTHEWVKVEGTKAKIGLSDHAQSELGDIVYINLPELDTPVTKGKAFTDIESVKAVSEVLSPVSGVIINVNDELDANPEKINEDPYGAWIVEVEVSELGDDLMTEEEYKEFIKE